MSFRRPIIVSLAALVALPLLGGQELPPLRPPVTPTTRPTPPPTTQPTSRPETPNLAMFSYVRKIEEAHGAAAWRTKDAVELRLEVTVGEEKLLDATLLYQPGTGRVRLDTAEGERFVFDGRHAWASRDATLEHARFHLLTWPYFLATPYKLRDPGTTLTRDGTRPLADRLCETVKLTFDPGTGDTPDDWYILYADPSTHQLAAMAYILTYGTTRAAAEDEPHAIVYEDFRRTDDVVISRRWSFRTWSADGGMGDAFGSAVLRDLRFVTPADDAFAKPEHATELAPPSE